MKGRILIHGYGSWHAMSVLHICDVSITSRWLSSRDLSYLADKDHFLLGDVRVLNVLSWLFLRAWWLERIKPFHSVVLFSSALACSIIHTGLCRMTKIALLCSLSAQLLCPRGLSREMETVCELQERTGNFVFSVPRCALSVEWLHVRRFKHTRQDPCEQPVWTHRSISLT